jgi:general secretion pathway protein J
MTTRLRTARRENSVAGFTLLEALVAMALMGFVIAALAAVTAQWLPNWNHGMTRIQRQEHVALGIERMVADLAAAEFIPANRETRRPFFDGAGGSVTFVRIGAGPHAGPGLEIVRISEDSSARQPMIIRTRAPFAPLLTDGMQQDQPDFTDPVVLLRPPYRLSFSYAGADRIWRETWRSQLDLPQAIKLTLRDATTQQTLSVSTATSLHSRISVECIATKSFAECVSAQSRPPELAESRSRS